MIYVTTIKKQKFRKYFPKIGNILYLEYEQGSGQDFIRLPYLRSIIIYDCNY